MSNVSFEADLETKLPKINAFASETALIIVEVGLMKSQAASDAISYLAIPSLSKATKTFPVA